MEKTLGYSTKESYSTHPKIEALRKKGLIQSTNESYSTHPRIEALRKKGPIQERSAGPLHAFMARYCRKSVGILAWYGGSAG